ncbi:hypothetical protein [Natrinema gelatinilyticum]|uniref:hypothetical protein n=1 Tax=Natrinema gelatinilyticum TaxID=2961571 RepID=UPI0020C2968F|nr:hypothetical protein [Natrinema gelatinilyticum]
MQSPFVLVVAKDNRNRPSRRNVIRSTAGLSSLGAASFLATGAGAAASGTRGKYGYGIDDSGYLVYYGDDDDAMTASTEAMNEAKDEGKLDFSMQNGAVTINSQTESQTQPDTGKIGALRWSRSPVCPGKTKYGNTSPLAESDISSGSITVTATTSWIYSLPV